MSNNTSSAGFHYIIGGLALIFGIFPYVVGFFGGKPELLQLALVSLLVPLAGFICLLRGLLRLQREGRLFVPDRSKFSAGKAILPFVASVVISMIIIEQAGFVKDPPMMFTTFFAATLFGLCVGLYLVGVRIIRVHGRG
ncbi:hypothetical protein [Cobetia marina]|uniref:hypothetical protein n=1 Tax=Cobetia marina TaxID=28258 RepID=UPI003A8CEAE4